VIGGIAAAVALGAAGWFAYMKLVQKGVLRYNRWDRRVRGTLGPGQPAPDVEVVGYDGAPLRFSTLWRERPVVLIFGSCT
jgi:hypothetical protein